MNRLIWLLLACSLPWLRPVSGDEGDGDDGAEAPEDSHPADLPTFADGVSVTVIYRPEPCVRTVMSGNWLELDFVARQMDDDGEELTEFDSTASRGRPFFITGKEIQLPGLNEGLKELCSGETRLITIAANEDLLTVSETSGLKQPKTDREAQYEVKVRAIHDYKPLNLFKMIDDNGDMKISPDEAELFFKTRSSSDEEKMKEQIDALFSHQDKDKDSVITFDEFQGPKHSHDEF